MGQDGNVLLVGSNTTDLYHGVGVLARFLGDPVGVNQSPTFTKGPDQSTSPNAGAQLVADWATGISTGADDEIGQSLSFLVQTTNPDLFASAPVISSSGTLTYTPAAGATAHAVVTVSLHDNGGTLDGGHDTSASQSFIINFGPRRLGKSDHAQRRRWRRVGQPRGCRDDH